MSDAPAGTERLVRRDGVELATEAFGDRGLPCVLLIMGAMASMLWWPEPLCRRLADAGFHVIRYDNRDTGRSTCCVPGQPDYTFDDMVDDVFRVLDAYGVEAAHLVGMSMGGAIAQRAALERPGRVKTLTLISTSPIETGRSELPGVSDAYAEHLRTASPPDWSDRASATDAMVGEMRALAGTAESFDEAAARETAERDFDRARSYASATNHYALPDGRPLRHRLSDLAAPLLVIHGDADPLFPIAHAEAFLEVLPEAGLVRLAGGGHELASVHCPTIVGAIADHAAH
jgi:pimeloyl-ACP methyl ester carboxylesterase